VLLEIGSWQPLKDIHDNNSGILPHDFRDLLLKKYGPRLAPRVGLSFTNAVISCLRDFDGDGMDSASSFRHFYDIDLVPLEEVSGCPL